MKSKLRMAVGLIILALLVTTVPFFGCAPEVKPPPPPVKETTLNIAFTAPCSGPFAAMAPEFLAGAKDYIQYANEESLVPGVKFELFTGDTAYTPAKSLSLYERFKGKDPIFFSTITTTDAEPLTKFLAEDKILGLCPSVSVPMISPPGWWFSTAFFYRHGFAGICRLIDEELWDWEAKGRPPRLVTIGWDNPLGRHPLEAKEWVEENTKVEYPLDIIIPFGIADATAELTRIKEAGADYLYMSAGLPEFLVILKTAAELGLRDKMTFIISFGQGGFYHVWKSPNILPLIGEVWLPGPYSYIGEDLPGTNLSRELQQKYHPDKFYETTAYYMPYLVLVAGIEAVKVAIEEVGLEKLTSADVKAVLESGRAFDTGGITKPFKWGKENRQVDPWVKTFMMTSEGEVKVVKDWYLCPTVPPLKK